MLNPEQPLITLIAPSLFWDITDTLTLKRLTTPLFLALLNRLMVWKCPTNRPMVHWAFRCLPMVMAHSVAPFIPRKRWESLSPLVLEALVVAWIKASYNDTNTHEDSDTTLLTQFVNSLAATWNLKTLADWDIQLISHAMPLSDSVLDQVWTNPLKFKKLLGLFQLDDTWPETIPLHLWPLNYWIARLKGLQLPWGLMRSTVKVGLPASRLNLWFVQAKTTFNASLFYTQRVLVLVEGQTEQRLLPLLGQRLGLTATDWWCCPVGGKSQMVSTYEQARQALNGPIIMVLDADAYPLKSQLLDRLRPQDRLCLLADGELEDQFDPQWLADTLNRAFSLHPLLDAAYFQRPNRVEVLKTLWRERQLGVFDKTSLVNLLAESLL